MRSMWRITSVYLQRFKSTLHFTRKLSQVGKGCYLRECGVFDGHGLFRDSTWSCLYLVESFSCVNKRQKRGGVGRILFFIPRMSVPSLGIFLIVSHQPLIRSFRELLCHFLYPSLIAPQALKCKQCLHAVAWSTIFWVGFCLPPFLSMLCSTARCRGSLVAAGLGSRAGPGAEGCFCPHPLCTCFFLPMVHPSQGSGQVGGQGPGTDSTCSLHFTA